MIENVKFTVFCDNTVIILSAFWLQWSDNMFNKHIVIVHNTGSFWLSFKMYVKHVYYIYSRGSLF